ncbi:PAAR domain-containing protein [Psychrobacter sp. NZS113]|uniref:PAAR domain-containing protein n=1 Tax=Psychrobacter sp. NZS113 TaxID=2792045 RepID=UPI0018CEEC1B|nr:PAAR domain-containing protein [Psychrobacter sp. NZS113]MBH0096696.1 PAAR domain-containing protein [Psychrobacter sp. NZS113]
MAAYITVGATTTHGGKVISGSPQTTHNGIPVSRKGDKVICKKCKKLTTILTGDASFIVDGAPIARAGDVTSCGAKLIAVQQSFCESGFEVMGVEEAEQTKREAQEYASKILSRYNTAFQFVADDDTPYVNYNYTAINKHSGQTYQGVTNEDGWTERFYSDNNDEIEIKLDLEWQNGLGVFE